MNYVPTYKVICLNYLLFLKINNACKKNYTGCPTVDGISVQF